MYFLVRAYFGCEMFVYKTNKYACFPWDRKSVMHTVSVKQKILNKKDTAKRYMYMHV